MKYTELFDAAFQAKKDFEWGGRARYRDGVVRQAALAAVGKSNEQSIEAMANIFEGSLISINPRWDGSIA